MNMTRREHNALCRQFDQLCPAAAVYVNKRIEQRVMTNASGLNAGVLIFCLEEVNRSDPILRDIQTWIDEANAKDMPRKKAEVASYVSKVCGRCGASDNLKTCDRCGLMRYCGRECQVADWKQHKKTCRSCKDTHFISCGGTSNMIIPDGQHKSGAKVVQADQDAILAAEWGGDYSRSEVAAIFKHMGDHGYSSAETRAFIENGASNGSKVGLFQAGA